MKAKDKEQITVLENLLEDVRKGIYTVPEATDILIGMLDDAYNEGWDDAYKDVETNSIWTER